MQTKVFEPGDIFKFENKEYIVVQNYGTNGLVKEYINNGSIIKGFSWNQKTDNCIYLRADKDYLKNNSVFDEYETFFKNM